MNKLQNKLMELVYDGSIKAEDGIKVYKELSDVNDSYNNQQLMEIAVVGMSGIFPHADNVSKFWENVVGGKDCIDAIDKRWEDISEIYSSESDTNSKSYCKWGGLLDSIYNFDPSFFELSPRQAELMEPRQRLILMEIWKTFEDAGFSKEQLNNSNCGVFIGCEGSSDYFKDMKGELMNGHVVLGHSNAILSSRISYFLNLTGANVTIDTACSSSLVAVHSACTSLVNGECEMAIAGGATVMTDPHIYPLLCSMGMLSHDGKCKTFDESADGFIPAESVASVLLMPLHIALEKKCHIYGIIQASGINQDGRTNGITAPSVTSQEKLIRQIYNKYSIDPRTIDYIEAHGTGTKLGDPIEIQALTKAFGYDEKNGEQYCGIGSIKTNIGHTAAASGIVSLIKVLLAMQHNIIPKTLHVKKVNKRINFQKSPFYVVDKQQEWLRKRERTRRAGINSFGYSGTNCHIVVEDYVEQRLCDQGEKMNYYIFPFSARTEQSLNEYLNKYLVFLQKFGDMYSMEILSYNLMICRTHFEWRTCIVSKDIEDFKQQLAQNIKKAKIHICNNNIQDSFKGKIEIIEADMLDYSYVSTLANYFLSGHDDDISWEKLYTDKYRISMPTYCFSREEFNIRYQTKSEDKQIAEITKNNLIDKKRLNKYYKILSKKDFFVKDHNLMLPGVVMIEMIMQCGLQNKPHLDIKKINNIVWRSPMLFIKDNIEVVIEEEDIALYETKYSIITYAEGEKTIHFQGIIEYNLNNTKCEQLDINNIVMRCVGGRKYAKYFYDCLENLGIGNGPGLQGMTELFYGEKEICAKIEIPTELLDTKDMYYFHPTLMDGGLHPIVGWIYNKFGFTDKVYLPFSAEEIQIKDLKRGLPSYVYITINHKMKNQDVQTISYDIKYLDKNGIVLYVVKNYSCREFVPPYAKKDNEVIELKDTLLYEEKWVENTIESNYDNGRDSWVLFTNSQQSTCWNEFKGRKVTYNCSTFKKINDFKYEINGQDNESYKLLIQSLRQDVQNNINYIFDLSDSYYDINEGLEYGVFSVFKLVQTLLSEFINTDTKIVIICNGEPIYQALNGFAKVLKIEKPQYHMCIISKEESISPYTLFLNEMNNCKNTEVLYRNDKRYTKILKKKKCENKVCNKIRKSGSYLITGGAGGVGLVFAEYLIEKYNAKVILTGRSDLTDIKEEKIRSYGKNVIYYKCDINNLAEIEELKAFLIKEKIELNGIIHAAGIIRDGMIIRKSLESFKEVISPKVFGLNNMLEKFDLRHLDFFVTFSSTSSVLGSLGQCDYAFGNSYQDNVMRKNSADKGKCRCLTINWPYWQSGGMRIDDKKIEMTRNAFGIEPLSNEQGKNAFEIALNTNSAQVVVVSGDTKKIDKIISEAQEPVLQDAIELQNDYNLDVQERYMNEDADVNKQDFSNRIKNIIKDIMKLEGDLDFSRNLSEFGFDSISYTELSTRVNEIFGLKVTPAEFFGFSYLSEIVDSLYGLYKANIQFDEANNTIEEKEEYNDFVSVESINCNLNTYYEPIAIIGLSGCLPSSENLNEFWGKIKNNKELVSEIPKDRWDWKEYYGMPTADNHLTNIKWGSFISDYDKFDPLFFNIAGFDTELMDPQERLVLEHIWRTMEDAGYSSSKLWDTDTGVFIGVSSADYKELLLDNKSPTMLTQTFIANRVSYVLNLHGPSEPIDTACSSSLVAIHKAIQSIHSGECKMAFAGAVNLILSPNLYITESKTNVLSQEGRCKTFDKHADGYVRGEGIATVLLKPLKAAIKDKDNIYGVIRGSAVNHGGRANNLFSPSVKAQSDVILRAMEKSKIDPHTISYIETHGTGTSLGDPIEIEGLIGAYQSLYRDYDYFDFYEKSIGIGSIKTNVGHLEAASGMASLIKVLFSFRDNLIPATINIKELNPYIKLEKSPFFIVDKNYQWISNDGTPRRAGISSFGVGGVNAHLIVEEYQQKSKKLDIKSKKEHIFILSAKTQNALNTRVKELRQFLNDYSKKINRRDALNYLCNKLSVNMQDIDMNDTFEELGISSYIIDNLKQKFDLTGKQISLQDKVKDVLVDDYDLDLEKLAYTLQEGRYEFKYRVAFISENKDKLSELFDMYLNGCEEDSPDNIITEKNSKEATITDLNDLIMNNMLSDIAALWVKGNHIEWSKFYDDICEKISIPGYPLEKEKYWYKKKETSNSNDSFIQVHSNTEKNTNFPIQSVTDETKKICAELLKIGIEKINEDDLFSDYGMDSIRFIEFTRVINERFSLNLEPFEVIECQNIKKLTNYILAGGNVNEQEIFENIERDSQQCKNSVNQVFKTEPITLISASNIFNIEHFEDFWVTLKTDNVEMLPVSTISNSIRQLISEQGNTYQHLVVENKLFDKAEIFVGGTGKTMVIITGIGVAPCFSKYQIEEFSKYYQVIVFSMPGVGLSSKVDELSLERLSKYVISTLETLETSGKLIIMGISWGALLASTIAAVYPDRVDKLILGSPISDMQMSYKEDDNLEKVDSEMKKDFMNVSGGKTGYDIFMKSKCINPNAYISYANYFGKKSPSPHSISNILSLIRCKTLIIYGKKDTVNSLEDSVIVANGILNSILIEMDDCAHLPMVTKPSEFNNIVLKFLTSDVQEESSF